MMDNDRIFYPVLLAALAICLGLYAEEALHFKHFGWSCPDNDTRTRDITRCQPVAGSATDVECPVEGYGLQRYQFLGANDPLQARMAVIDRIR